MTSTWNRLGSCGPGDGLALPPLPSARAAGSLPCCGQRPGFLAKHTSWPPSHPGSKPHLACGTLAPAASPPSVISPCPPPHAQGLLLPRRAGLLASGLSAPRPLLGLLPLDDYGPLRPCPQDGLKSQGAL